MALSKINQLIKTKTEVFKFSPVMSPAKIKCEPQKKKNKIVYNTGPQVGCL